MSATWAALLGFSLLLGGLWLWLYAPEVRGSPIVLLWGFALFVIGFGFGKESEREGEREGERYTEGYAVAVRLREAGQELQKATAKGSRGEVISAELHWLDAVADVESLRPPR